MTGINQVTLLGHLGRDPETRQTQDGRPVVTFSIATSESWKDKTSGEKRERTEWHNVVIFNEGLCGIAEKFLKKGSKVAVIGKMQTRKWVHQDGADRYSTEVVLTGFGCSLVLCDRASGERAPAPAAAEQTGEGPKPPARPKPEMDDDIPF